MARRSRIGADLLSDEEYRMMGEALQMAAPLPPGLDWDYFRDDKGELGDTENPAVDAVFDWGQPRIGESLSSRVRWPNMTGRVIRQCVPQPCVPPQHWPPRWPGAQAIPSGPGAKPCPPRPCGAAVPLNPGALSKLGSFHVGAEDGNSWDWEICERVVPAGRER